MIPSYEDMAKQAIVRVFNTIMTRAGITLIVTVAFCISSMFYNISTDYPFFMIAFLQIVCFAGIYMKLGDLMSMFSLKRWGQPEHGTQDIPSPVSCSCDTGLGVWNTVSARAVGAGSVAGAVAGTAAGATMNDWFWGILSSAGSKRAHANTTRKRDSTTFWKPSWSSGRCGA